MFRFFVHMPVGEPNKRANAAAIEAGGLQSHCLHVNNTRTTHGLVELYLDYYRSQYYLVPESPTVGRQFFNYLSSSVSFSGVSLTAVSGGAVSII